MSGGTVLCRRGVQRSIRLMRILRVVAGLAVVLNAPSFALDAAAGSSLAFIPALCIVALLAFIVMQTRLIGNLQQRDRELSRPHMTAGDYRKLREMEIELGWEPSEPSVPRPAASMSPVKQSSVPWCTCSPGRRFPVEIHAVGQQAPVGKVCATCGRRISSVTIAVEPGLSAGAALSSTGSVAAKPAWDDVAYASEASEHFAQLARAGRKWCLSYCPICAGRLEAHMRAVILAPKPDLGDVQADLDRDMRDLWDLNRAVTWTEDGDE